MDVASHDVAVWMGAAIGPAAFEVGDDVRDAFLATDAAAAAHFRPHRDGKWLAGLAALARQRLSARGVIRIAALDACTFGDAARFHSWRRDRTSGRLAAIVWRAPTGAV
jgi:copper oxidase (laccase) domain-containing protein